MIDFTAALANGLSYSDYLEKHGTDAHRERWAGLHARIQLSADQQQLISGLTRQIKMLCMAGAWCGDCVEQCPILDHFAEANSCIELRFVDRDDCGNLKDELTICGGARVPVVLFANEDDQIVSRFGDRTLAKYRQMAHDKLGDGCPTGLVPPADALTTAVTQHWLDELERVHLLLRMSPRLREKHGD